MITYRFGNDLHLDQMIQLYRDSTLGQRRPIDDQECMHGMLEGADLIVTAWDGEKMVGIARSVTDFCYACYLSDLAVDEAYQRQGIGKQLVIETRKKLGPKCTLILLSAPKAVEYYPKIGFEEHDSCWILKGETPLRD